MGAYRLLFEIDVRHGYYADEACPGLRFWPTPPTETLIGRAGGVVTPTARGIALLVDVDEVGGWWPIDAEATDAEALTWLVQAGQAGFTECTAALGRPSEALWVFDAAQAVPDAQPGCLRLHGQETASAQDLQPWPAAWRSQWPHGSRFAPFCGSLCGLVRIPLQALKAAAEANSTERFVIRFAPRATVWKYCLVGTWPEPELQVIDLAREVTFEPAAPCQLADGRSAIVFRSTAPIALRQQPAERFQLRSRAAEGPDSHRARPEKVIVKRLPAAAPRHFSREVIGGAPALVSEIFVHR